MEHLCPHCGAKIEFAGRYLIGDSRIDIDGRWRCEKCTGAFKVCHECGSGEDCIEFVEPVGERPFAGRFGKFIAAPDGDDPYLFT